MKNRTIIWWTIFAVSALFSGCIREDRDDRERGCHRTLYLYSQNREGQNVLLEEVDHGQLFVYNSEGQLVHSEEFLPMVKQVTLDLPEGAYDIVVTGNVTSRMEYNQDSVKVENKGHIRYKKQDAVHYSDADDVHLGKFEGYVVDNTKPNRRDSVNVKRMVGRMTAIVNKMDMSPADFNCEMLVSGTTHGVDFHQKLMSDTVRVKSFAEIENQRVQLDALCFSSLEQLKVRVSLVDKHTGAVMAVVEKELPERMGPNKWIIVEYDYNGGGFLELEVVIKDWYGRDDADGGEAITD